MPSALLRLMIVILSMLIGFSFLLMLGSCKERIPLIEQKCGTCHSASVVYQTRRTQEDWRRTMHGMKIRGMVITEEEEQQIYDILFRDYLLK